MSGGSGPYVRIPAWVIIVAGSAATIAALVWVSTLYDDHSRPILDQPLAFVLVAFLGLVGTMLTLIYKRTREVKEQVSNHHIDERGRPVLMRIEQDDRHAETLRLFGELRDDLAGMRGDFRDVRRDVGGIREELRGLTTQGRTTASDVALIQRRQDALTGRVAHLEKEGKE